MGKKIQKKPQISDEEINKKYLAGEVRIVTEQARYPLDTIMGMIDSGKYELMPSFQRRHRWNAVKKSRLIESFIMNVPIPPIFLYENEYSHYEVMDGLQRMTTIYEFYQDKFALTGLEQWAELNGKVYSALPEKIKQGIDRRYLSSIILLHESAKDQQKAQEMKQLVFERINTAIGELYYLARTSNYIPPFIQATNRANTEPSVKPTLSPKDPAFPAWWEAHKGEWEQEQRSASQ